MKLLLKLLLIIVLLLALLVGIAVFLFFRSIDTVAKEAVERGGTYAMEVDTTLDKANVGIFSGSFDMSGLTVANPAGFDSPHFFTLSSANATVDYGSMSGPTVRIPSVTLTGIDMNMQRTGDGSNYQTILNSLKRLESGEAPPPPSETGDTPPAAVIDTLAIRDITVHLDLLPMPGALATLTEATKLEVEIPEIILTNVGGDEPVPTSELAGVVLKAIFQAVLAKSGGVLPEGALGDLTNSLSQLSSLGDLGAVFGGSMGDELNTQMNEALSDALGNVTDQATEAVDQASEELQNVVDDGVNQINDRIRDLNPFGGGGNNDDNTEGEGGG